PENIFAPSQTLGILSFACTLGTIDTKSSFTVNAGARQLGMPLVRIPVTALAGTGGIIDMIKGAVFQSTGYLGRTANGDADGVSITLNDTYPVKATFTFANTPSGADVTAVVLADYSGGDGTGTLGMNGVQVHKYNDTGTTIVVPVGTVSGAPAGT